MWECPQNNSLLLHHNHILNSHNTFTLLYATKHKYIFTPYPHPQTSPLSHPSTTLPSRPRKSTSKAQHPLTSTKMKFFVHPHPLDLTYFHRAYSGQNPNAIPPPAANSIRLPPIASSRFDHRYRNGWHTAQAPFASEGPSQSVNGYGWRPNFL